MKREKESEREGGEEKEKREREREERKGPIGWNGSDRARQQTVQPQAVQGAGRDETVLGETWHGRGVIRSRNGAVRD